ncbi:MAG: hypothetical protein ACLF0G_07480 [Candidatus Brocadiia bacterium]
MAVAVSLAGALLAAGDAWAAEHPYILWTPEDLASARKTVETQDWARAVYEQMVAEPHRHERSLANLFRYAVMGEGEAGAKEKKKLLRVMSSPVPRGGAQWLTVLRYDLLYDRLADDQRQAFHHMARVYIKNAVFENAVFNPEVFNDSRNYSRYDARRYTRTNWLPNIIWPRKVSANLMALALGEEALIRKTWAAYGSWKWYFDAYLCDSGFYAEEFSKMGSTPGAMLVACMAFEHLGLGELGFGYRGTGGATMRGHIESIIHLGYPRVLLGSERPHYPMVTIGDLRQVGSSQADKLPSPAFQHCIVTGYLPDGTGGNLRWRAHGAWGGEIRGRHAQWDGYTGFTPKMQLPLWFEIARRRWPDAGFGYFLVQMRPPDQERYIPTLYFGLQPLAPGQVEAPAAPSAVWPERGLAMLRAEESAAYWESPAPAACLRLATPYAHSVNDSFALAGFYALNRPIYLNRQVTPGYAQDWSRSIQSHCGVSVDGQEPCTSSATTVREAFAPEVKFLAARNREVFPEVDLARSLFLTREYLLDLTCLASDRPRRYTWFVHALGEARPEEPERWRDARLPEGLEPLEDVRACEAGPGPWALVALQTCALDDPSEAKLPRAWYDRRVGVRLAMLGAPGTTAYVARTPLPVRKYRDGDGKRRYETVASEVGGVTVVVAREARRTVFAALHEPLEGGRRRIAAFRPIERTPDALAVAVVGEEGTGIEDRAMVRFGDRHGEPITLAGEGERFTFAGHAYVRIGRQAVVARGDIRAMETPVAGRPRLVVNGEEQRAAVAGGVLTYPAPR